MPPLPKSDYKYFTHKYIQHSMPDGKERVLWACARQKQKAKEVEYWDGQKWEQNTAPKIYLSKKEAKNGLIRANSENWSYYIKSEKDVGFSLHRKLLSNPQVIEYFSPLAIFTNCCQFGPLIHPKPQPLIAMLKFHSPEIYNIWSFLLDEEDKAELIT